MVFEAPAYGTINFPKEAHYFLNLAFKNNGISVVFEAPAHGTINFPKEFQYFLNRQLEGGQFSYGISILFDVISKGSRNNMLTRWMLHGLNAANP